MFKAFSNRYNFNGAKHLIFANVNASQLTSVFISYHNNNKL